MPVLDGRLGPVAVAVKSTTAFGRESRAQSLGQGEPIGGTPCPGRPSGTPLVQPADGRVEHGERDRARAQRAADDEDRVEFNHGPIQCAAAPGHPTPVDPSILRYL